MSLKLNNDTANGSSILQPSNTATGDVTHTLPAFTTELAPRMQLMTAQNSTSGTSIDFTGIPSWAKKITVMFNGVSTNGVSGLLVQIGTTSGFEITGYTSAGNTTLSTVGTAGSTAGFYMRQLVSSLIASGTMELVKFSDSNNYVERHTVCYDTVTAGSGGGDKTLSGTLDRIRITTVNGTDLFDAGQINIMYEG